MNVNPAQQPTQDFPVLAPGGYVAGPVTVADPETTARILSEFGFLPKLSPKPAHMRNSYTTSSHTSVEQQVSQITAVEPVVLAQPVIVREDLAAHSAFTAPTVLAAPAVIQVPAVVAVPVVERAVVVEQTLPPQPLPPLANPNSELPTRTTNGWVKGRLVWKKRFLSLQQQFLYSRKKQDDEFYQRRIDITYCTIAADGAASKNGRYAIMIDNPVHHQRIKVAFESVEQRTEWATLLMAYRQHQLIKLGAVASNPATDVTHFREAGPVDTLAEQTKFHGNNGGVPVGRDLNQSQPLYNTHENVNSQNYNVVDGLEQDLAKMNHNNG